jgi:hypothetical protein
LVTGGSQGAVSLNRALAGAVGAITGAGVQVLHVTGPKHLNEIQAPPGPVPYVAVPFVDRMDLAYAAADFALCRAGAMTCAELTAVGLPAAYVPLPHGNGEQRLNALPIVQRGGGLLVDDAELTAEWIKASLLPVLTNIDQVAGMSEAAAAMGRKDADRLLAKAVIDTVSADTANRVSETGREPEADRPPTRPAPTPRPAPAPGPAPTPRTAPPSAPAGQWASPPPPPAPAPAEPGSLFTPRTPRHQQGAGWTQPSPEEQRQARGRDARDPFPPSQSPAGQARPNQLAARQGPPGPFAADLAPSARPPQAQPSLTRQPPAAQPPRPPQPPRVQAPQAQPRPAQPPQAQPLPGRLPQSKPGPAPTPPSSGPGRHRQARS